MALLRFSGICWRAPKGGRELGQLIIGAALVLYFTPQVAREALGIWPLLTAAAVLSVALGWICGLFLSWPTDSYRTAAFFASVPDRAAEMAVLDKRFGGKIDRIALAQWPRIMMLLVIIPFALTFVNGHGADPYARVLLPVDALGLLLTGCTLGARFEQEFGRKTPRYMPVVALSARLLAQLGVPLVTAAHVTSVLIFVIATAPLFRLAQRFGAGCA